MADVAEALSKVSGLSKEQIQAIFLDVKANSAKLEACDGHIFQKAGDKINAQHVCSRCGGYVDHSAAYWYRLGLAHAR